MVEVVNTCVVDEGVVGVAGNTGGAGAAYTEAGTGRTVRRTGGASVLKLKLYLGHSQCSSLLRRE